MSERMSTGLCNQLLDTGSLKSIFDGGRIRIFDGTPPTNADAAEAGNLLCELTESADGVTGLTFDSAAASGTIAKTPAEDWSGVNAASGTATYWRLVATGDTAASSTTEPRIQGTIGTGGTDILVADTTFTIAVTFTLLAFTQSFVPG